MHATPRQLALLLVAATACSGPGCRWNHWLRRNGSEPPPILFTALPSPAEAVAAVNANTRRVQSLQTHGATLSVPGAPAITANIAVERPLRLRLRAGTQLLGPELDLGSNDQLFWLWAARMPDSAVYFARHDQFAASRARQMLAVEPAWLIEALGLVEIEPAGVIEGPLADGGDRVRLRTVLATAGGPHTRLIVLHAKYGWVLEQHVYDERGQLIASARNSAHEYYPLDGVSLPKHVEVNVPQGLLRLQLDVDRWGINQPLMEGQALFELPRQQLGNYQFVDLADPNFVPPISAAPSHLPQPALPPQADTRPRHRGFPQWR